MGVAAGGAEGRKPMQSWRYLEVQKPWIPNCFAIILFHHFVKRDILFFSKGIYYCSPNFDLFSKTQTRLG